MEVLGWEEDWALELVGVSALALVEVQELVLDWHWVVVAVVHCLPVLHSLWVAPLLQEDLVEAPRFAAGPASGAAVAPLLSRAAEKHTLSGLNDRFSTYMAKVRALQQENAALEAKLSQLTGGTDVSQESSVTATVEYEAQLSEYRNTFETLTIDTVKLEIELDNVRGTAHELKAK